MKEMTKALLVLKKREDQKKVCVPWMSIHPSETDKDEVCVFFPNVPFVQVI